MSKILEIHKLSAGYGPLRVLHEIDLSLNKGEINGAVTKSPFLPNGLFWE